jgi:adenylate cyclase
MAVEIERKFLLADDRWRAAIEHSERLAQGYLGGSRASVRVRIGGGRAWLNIKARVRGAARLEFEYPIPLADGEQLLAELCEPGRIDKVRHHVRHAGALWEIDEFGGANAGLVVAEIELDAVDSAFERPAWLGREVTDQARYYNVALAERPYAQWSDSERAG